MPAGLPTPSSSWRIVIWNFRGPYAGVSGPVSMPRAYVFPVLTNLAASTTAAGLRRLAAPISSSGPNSDLGTSLFAWTTQAVKSRASALIKRKYIIVIPLSVDMIVAPFDSGY